VCPRNTRVQVLCGLVRRRRGAIIYPYENYLEKGPAESLSPRKQLTISSQPQPLLRSSPLGLFVRRNYLTLSRMDLDELQDWWISFERWIDGEKRGKRRAVEEHDSSPEFACVEPFELLLDGARCIISDGLTFSAKRTATAGPALVRTIIRLEKSSEPFQTRPPIPSPREFCLSTLAPKKCADLCHDAYAVGRRKKHYCTSRCSNMKTKGTAHLDR
jgi:hypothetical protein